MSQTYVLVRFKLVIIAVRFIRLRRRILAVQEMHLLRK